MTYLQHLALRREDCAWPRKLREQVLREGVAHGELINALRVEPALRTPARGGLPDTVGRRTPSGWLLNGHNLYTTGSRACTGSRSGGAATTVRPA